jgi:hypothetical protein
VRVSKGLAVTAVAAAAATIAALSPVPLAAAECPAVVTAAVQKAHAGATIASCKQEEENGKPRFRVKLAATSAKGMELDVTPGGAIILTEQDVAVSDVPPVIMATFAAKFGAVKPTRATMQTASHGKITYELAFVDGIRKKEATFALDGAFIEAE